MGGGPSAPSPRRPSQQQTRNTIPTASYATAYGLPPPRRPRTHNPRRDLLVIFSSILWIVLSYLVWQVGVVVETIRIHNNDVGFGYERVFRRVLEAGNYCVVTIQDAYLSKHHQVMNLIRLMELLVRHSRSLSAVYITTTVEADEAKTKLGELRDSLRLRNIVLTVKHSDTVHDREIAFDNGYIVKIGRGLDYFKPPDHKFGLGAFDFDLRKCKETTIDIYKYA